MSCSGKSYWSKKLEEKGFKRFCCDNFIGKELCGRVDGLNHYGIVDLAKWMGQPFDPQYKSTSQAYLDFERKGMVLALAAIENSKPSENSVIDTTGSVIYLGEEILSRLSATTKVVYLETPNSFMKEMYKLYREDPKPVIWGNAFNKKGGETNFEALSRCYSDLLAFRAKEYRKIADITLDYNTLRNPDFTVDQFMGAIEND